MEKIDALKQAKEYYEANLPFYVRNDFKSCYAHKLYKWQMDFLLNRNLLAFLTAANQIGKSSIQIIRALNQAMRQDLWPYWFPTRSPKTFLYLYPESKLATTEWHEKWIKTYMPRGKMTDDQRYGWKPNYDNKKAIESVKFASGVTIYFRNYSQSPTALQGISADCVFLDEETPEAHFDELLVRSQARQAEGSGYVSMCFTATLGQLYLYKCMEMQGTDQETFVGAWKRQISAFDCLRYADGTHSGLWTKKFIEQELIPKYRTAAEVQRRIYGRFIKTGGLLHEDFDMDRNTEPYGATNVEGWSTYVGIDFGSGGEYGHSSTIVIAKVDPSYTQVRIVRSWSSKKTRMTQADLLVQYQMLTSAYEDVIAYADWSATDFFEFAARESVPINKAEKSHDLGVNLLNMVFRDGQLKIWLGEEAMDNGFLIQELRSISQDTPKNKRVDDLADALRYSLSLCPLRVTSNFEAPKKEEKKVESARLLFYEGRDGRMNDPMLREDDDIMVDFDEAVRMYEELL